MICWQANKKGQADKYSALINFKTQHEANEAFDKLEGNQEKVGILSEKPSVHTAYVLI